MNRLASCDAMRLPSILILLSLFAPFSSDRQHLSYDGCLEVRREVIKTVLCCIVYWSHKSHLDEQFLQFSGFGFVTMGPSLISGLVLSRLDYCNRLLIDLPFIHIQSLHQSKMPQQGSSSTWDVATTSLTRSSVSIGSACRSELHSRWRCWRTV